MMGVYHCAQRHAGQFIESNWGFEVA